MSVIRRPRRLTAATVVLAVLAVTGLSGCDPVPDTYVAMGDSFVAGPFIPTQSLDPAGCLRSEDNNYPNVVNVGIPVERFVDVSCSGATTADFYAPQDVTPGPPNPPQLDALDGRTKVVTVGIGGNDIGFTDIVINCSTQDPLGSGCKADYVEGDQDELRDRIDAAAPDVRQAFEDIAATAPNAEVFVVGYPTVVPETGDGCYPVVPILPSDIPYLRGIAKDLNAMIADQAAAAGVHFVDVASSSIGHDVCASQNQRWVEGVFPTQPAAPVHPNAKGMIATGAVVTKAINAVVTS